MPLIGKTNEEILKQAIAAEESEAQIVEWRVDHYKHVEDQQAVLDALSHIRTTLKHKELLFTFRTLKKGRGRSH